jgi:hypothetical protein
MEISEILAAIDREIALLMQARVLMDGRAAAKRGKTAGKLKRAAAVKATAPTPAKRKKRTLSPEGRKRIAEAQKKRWEAHKKAAPAAQK